jgi:hypothetical protein
MDHANARRAYTTPQAGDALIGATAAPAKKLRDVDDFFVKLQQPRNAGRRSATIFSPAVRCAA